MSWRKWLVRSLVFSLTGAALLGGLLYEQWTSPAAVRRQVLDHLSNVLPGALSTVDSAHVRLLGGIAVNELRLFRRDDPDRGELAYFPSAVIYHDKQQLVEGRLAIRKMEFHRPRLHLIRGPDGRWNFAGLLGPARPDEPIPTMVLSQGTFLIEDRSRRGGAVIEIKDVSLTLLNDPLPTVTFQGKGTSDVAGTVHLSGTWERDTGEVSLSVEAADVPVGPALVPKLAAYAPDLAEHAGHLTGTARLQADVGYPGGDSPWTYDVRLQLSGGALAHPQLPLPLDHLEASVRCLPGEIRVESLKATAGGAHVDLTGTAWGADCQADFSADVTVRDLPLGAEIFQGRLPENLRRINEDYSPCGPVSLTYHVARRSGHWARHCLVHPQGIAATFRRFPYPVTRITGTLDQDIDTGRGMEVLRIDLTGYAGACPVLIKGQVTGEGPTSGVDVQMTGKNLLLDETLVRSLPGVYQNLARSFHPAGQCDFLARVHRPAGAPEWDNRYLVQFHDASVCYDAFPYPLERVSGLLDVGPHGCEFRNFHGTRGTAHVQCSGRSEPGPQGNHLTVSVAGGDVPLDPALEAGLVHQPELQRSWKTFRPAGLMNFRAVIERTGDQPPEADVTLQARGCTVQPVFFPYRLTDLTGTVHYARREVQVTDVRARHGRTVVTLDEARALLKPDGGVWTDLLYLRGSPLVPDGDLLQALPPTLAKVVTGLALHDPVDLQTRLVIETRPETSEPAVIFWDGEMKLQDATLQTGIALEHVTGRAACCGRFDGRQLEGLQGNFLLEGATAFRQPFRNVQSHLQIYKQYPDVLLLPNFRADLFGGDVGGTVKVDFGSVTRYEINLTAAQVQLEQFAKHNLDPSTPISGMAGARLFLKGEGTDLENLAGAGVVDVPQGRLFNLPFFLDLLKVLGLRRPDGTFFEEAHAAFTVHGPRVAVSRLDLFGNSLSLRGQGSVNLDGSDVNLDFYAVWARALQVLPPVLKEIPATLSKYILKIEARGRVGDVRFTKVPAPTITEPIRDLLEKMPGARKGP